MKLAFINKNFKQDTLNLIKLCCEILDDYAADGYDLTVRQLYYQLVAKDLIENTDKSYARISSMVNDARMAGLIDWDMIVDRGRQTIEAETWEDPSQAIEDATRFFRIDRWKFQPFHLEVMCEKQALEGVLSQSCLKWGIPFTANKGYSSQSCLYKKGEHFSEIMRDGKRIVILYFGDHDPSGIDMDRDLISRLRMFSGVDEGFDKTEMDFDRVALTQGQIELYNPPPNPAKITDSRAKGYIKKFGNRSWELDALTPRQLATMLDDAVSDSIDIYGQDDLWNESIELEKKMRIQIQGVLDGSLKDSWKEEIQNLSDKVDCRRY
jgi:hypothetical protein